jgi:hypothetical protein
MTRKKFFQPGTALSSRKRKQVQQAGLPLPVDASQKFADLQKQWYAKLETDGFEDIEWVNHSTGKGQDSSYLRGSMQSGKPYHPGRDLYYQLASNYLQHCKNLRRNKSYNYFIWKLHTEGATFTEILEALKRRQPKSVPSRYTLFYDVRRLAKQCYRWNATNPEGLLVKRREDEQKKAESLLAEFENTEYNWLSNEQFAAQEKAFAKQKKTRSK